MYFSYIDAKCGPLLQQTASVSAGPRDGAPGSGRGRRRCLLRAQRARAVDVPLWADEDAAAASCGAVRRNAHVVAGHLGAQRKQGQLLLEAFVQVLKEVREWELYQFLLNLIFKFWIGSSFKNISVFFVMFLNFLH